MKKIYFMVMLCITYISGAQTSSYNDLGVLFSKENSNGTARFNAMSGAFGALGGDISAIETNPAGAAVFLTSEFAVSLNNRSTETTSTFYGNNEMSSNDYLNLSQAGGVFVFDGYNGNNGWGKIAIGFNFSISNDFKNLWLASGNSDFAPISDFYDPTLIYPNAAGNYFENFSDGRNNKYTFTIASQHNENLYLGASLSSYDIQNYQNGYIEEYTNDGGGNDLTVTQTQKLSTFGDGLSFNFGLISKPNENIRLGLAYQSPVWYRLSEEFVKYDVNIYENNIDITNTYPLDDTYSGLNAFDYQLRTPSKVTGSFAYIFNKQGLVSVDYAYKNYSNIKISSPGFSEENAAFKTNLEGSGEFRIGTEWRLDAISIRGGYHFEKSPYKNALSSDNIEGFSIGAGYKFRGGKLDFSYQKSSNTSFQDFYSEHNDLNRTNPSNQINPVELDFNNSKFTATLVLNI